MIDVKIVNKSGFDLPGYATKGSAGIDIKASLPEGTYYRLEPGRSIVIPTGLYMDIPEGYEAQVRPRSGLAANHSVTVLNSPGTIDSDYRGEIGVILINHGKFDFVVKSGERIGQIVFAKYERPNLIEALKLEETDRGSGGFGSTGK